MTETAPPSADILRMDAPALRAFLLAAFPKASASSRAVVMEAEPGRVQVQLNSSDDQLRPGGIVSGPTLMGLADVAAYALVLAHIGEVAMTVTSSLSIHFLRPCRPGVVIGEARLLRLGRKLATAEVRIWTDNAHKPVAQATVTYAIP